MPKFALTVGIVFVLVVAGLAIALSWPMPRPDSEPFMEILPPPGNLEARPDSSFVARDGRALPLRVHAAEDADIAAIMLHGGGLHGDYLYPVAAYLAEQSVATVFVPDLRGHGDAVPPRGDIDHAEQLVEDLADLIMHVREQNDWARVVVGGHSMGGGLAVRMAGTDYADMIDSYLLVAPFLGSEAPTTLDGYGGYVYPNVPRITALRLLNTLGITIFDGTDVFQFNPPDDLQEERATLRYSWRMAKGGTTPDYASDLAAIETPLLVVVGDEDEMFVAENYGPLIEEHAPHGEVVVLSGFNHVTDVLNKHRALEQYADWLQRLDG